MAEMKVHVDMSELNEARRIAQELMTMLLEIERRIKAAETSVERLKNA